MGPDESPFAARFKDGLELGPIEVLKSPVSVSVCLCLPVSVSACLSQVLKSPGLEVSFPVTAERKKR